MMEISKNDVLLQHNTHKLAYAHDTTGNHRFNVLLDIYRDAFQIAERERDDETCMKIVSDIVHTICFKCQPNGRFLEFDEKKNIWHNVGTGAIPCQRARTGLLNLIGDPIAHNNHLDKPIVEMNKTERARTMKALHFNEKKLRAVINLKDDRFVLKEGVSLISTTSVPSNAQIEPKKNETKRNRVTFAIGETPKRKKVKKPISKKKNKILVKDVSPFDVKCGGTVECVEFSDNPGNKLFHFLVNVRRKSYEVADDKEKFKETCRVIRFMRKIYPSSRFVQRVKNSSDWYELSWQSMLEKTIQCFCEPTKDILSDAEIKDFMHMIERSDVCYNFLSEIIDDTCEIESVDVKASIVSDMCYSKDEVLSIVNDDNKPILTESVEESDVCVDEMIELTNIKQEDDEFLDVLFSSSDQSYQEVCSADEWLNTILVAA